MLHRGVIETDDSGELILFSGGQKHSELDEQRSLKWLTKSFVRAE